MTPAPLTPHDCDLRDFPFMPVETDRLLKSETWIEGSGDERAAAISLWLQSWHQVPAGSLPNKDEVLAHLAITAKWKKLKPHALRGWLLCSDGRLYHPVVCEKVLEAWIEKLLNSLSGSAGNAKRWGIDIDITAIKGQLLVAIKLLRALAPQSKTFKKKAVAAIVAGSPPDSPPDDHPSSPPDSPTDRKGQRQGQGHINTLSPAYAKSTSTSDGDNPGTFAPTLAGQVGMAMKAAGVDPTTVNLSDPRLAELLRQGAVPDEFAGLAREAIAKGIGGVWPWVLKVLPERRAQAAAIALAPKVEQQETPRQRAARERTEEAAGVYAQHLAKPAPNSASAPEALQLNDDEVIHVHGTAALSFDHGDD